MLLLYNNFYEFRETAAHTHTIHTPTRLGKEESVVHTFGLMRGNFSPGAENKTRQTKIHSAHTHIYYILGQGLSLHSTCCSGGINRKAVHTRQQQMFYCLDALTSFSRHSPFDRPLLLSTTRTFFVLSNAAVLSRPRLFDN